MNNKNKTLKAIYSFLIIQMFLFVSCALHRPVNQTGPFSGFYETGERVKKSHLQTIDSIKPEIENYVYFKTHDYSECLLELKQIKGVKEITGIPETSDTISKIVEFALAAIGPLSPVVFLSSKKQIKNIYNFGYPVFLIDNLDYKEILPFVSYYTVSVKKCTKRYFIFNNSFWGKQQKPNFVVNIVRKNIPNESCVRKKFQLFISLEKENMRIIAYRFKY